MKEIKAIRNHYELIDLSQCVAGSRCWNCTKWRNGGDGWGQCYDEGRCQGVCGANDQCLNYERNWPRRNKDE